MGQESYGGTTTQAEGVKRDQLPTRYTDIVAKEERTRPQTSNTNGGLDLVYVRDWSNESIGVIKKALRTEIGQATGAPASQDGQSQQHEHWPDVNAVRHINQYSTPTSSLLDIACTTDKSDILRDFFSTQGIEVCDRNLNPCIDPAIKENNEMDNKQLGKRLNNHFMRLLLS